MVYKEHFRHPHKLAKLIQNDLCIDINKIIRCLAHEIINESDGNTQELHEYFNNVYNELYDSILSKHIHLQTKTQDLLRLLANPQFNASILEQEQIIDTYLQ